LFIDALSFAQLDHFFIYLMLVFYLLPLGDLPREGENLLWQWVCSALWKFGRIFVPLEEFAEIIEVLVATSSDSVAYL